MIYRQYDNCGVSFESYCLGRRAHLVVIINNCHKCLRNDGLISLHSFQIAPCDGKSCRKAKTKEVFLGEVERRLIEESISPDGYVATRRIEHREVGQASILRWTVSC